jgi:hypothetical protein
LKTPSKNEQQKKALLAIVFASSLLNAHLPVSAANESKSESHSLIGQKIANNSHLSPEIRAFFLLTLARDYLAGCDKKDLEARFSELANQTKAFQIPRRFRNTLDGWAQDVFTGKFFFVFKDNKPDPHKTNAEEKKQNRALANSAIDLAVSQLDTMTDKYSKLIICFIAMRIYEKTDNTTGISECKTRIDYAVKTCEAKTQIDIQEIESACTALNLLAMDIIPISITDREPKSAIGERKIHVNPITESDFNKSEKLRLRAITLADRLGTDQHLRRKMHRDMALWYEQLGKKSLADSEKNVLYNLVGIRDEKILYPVDGACGHLRWWTLQQDMYAVDCGMG